MRVALIKLNTVVNIIDADHIPADFYGHHFAVESLTARMGDSYINGDFRSNEGTSEDLPELPISTAGTYKNKGLTRAEYIELFTLKERALYFRFMDNMYGNLSFMPSGTVVLKDRATLVGSTLSYFDIMIIGKGMLVYAIPPDGINLEDPAIIAGITAMSLLGMLDSPTRVNTILRGKPL